jgi:hypothetical protein
MKAGSVNLLFLATVITGGVANAIEPVPDTPGWSGLVTMGLGALDAKTNMVAGIDRYNIDIGEKKINSLSAEPDSKSTGMPQLNLNINYTFASQTQLYFGNSLENVLQFDTAAIAGVRQQFSDKSILEVGMVSTPFLSPTQTWEDPYVVGVNRKETDRTSRGPRIEYDNILGTGFGVQYTQRKTEIDKERSGTTQLGLPADQAELLKRDGDTRRFVGYYRFPRIERNVFEIRVGRLSEDLDGKAMSGDQDQIQLTYVYLGDRFTVASNLFAAQQDFDKRNPVFDKTRSDDTLGLGIVVIDKKIFNSKQWFGQASLVWYDQDSNIDFYDASTAIFTAGAQYRF